MPESINGVGTHYYGSRNRTERFGKCQSCGFIGNLSSYDTGLYGVLLFIPIVPLGRKRVIDQCPACRRHLVAPLKDYESHRQARVAAVLAGQHTDRSPESAGSDHGVLLACYENTRADELRSDALARFPDNAEMRIAMAIQLEYMNRYADATPLYEQALRIRPQLPEARIGVAHRRVGQHQVTEAHELLRFLEEPGAGQTYNLSTLELLAYEYERQANYPEAFRLCQVLLRETPGVANCSPFRDVVKRLERRLERTSTVLPPRKYGSFDERIRDQFTGRRLALAGCALALMLIVGLVIANYYIREHRTLFVVNGYGEPIQVQIDGGPPASVIGTAKFRVAEGPHTVTWSGVSEGTTTVELQSSYFRRWSHRPIWIVNIDGVTPLVQERIHYAVSPQPGQATPLIGKAWVAYDHIDFPFETPPPQLRLHNRSDVVTKQRMYVEPMATKRLAEVVTSQLGDEVALRFAESHLRSPIVDEALVEYYTQIGGEQAFRDRKLAILRAGLWKGRVSVVWHRNYQDLLTDPNDEAELITAYDVEIQKPCESLSAVLYLRAQFAPTLREARDWLDRSFAADATNGWPQYDRAVTDIMRGDWQSAVPRLSHAVTAGAGTETVRSTRRLALVATGQAAQAEAELNEVLKSGTPREQLGALLELCDVLAGQRRCDEMQPACQAWSMRNPWGGGVAQRYRSLLAYLRGDFENAEVPSPAQAASAANSDFDPHMHLHHLLAQGKNAEAASLLTQMGHDPFQAVAVACSFYADGNPARGDAWIEWACALLEQGNLVSRRAAQLLRQESAPTFEQLTDVPLPVGRQALIAATLGCRYPERREDFHALARRLNVSRLPPYRLIDRVTQPGESTDDVER